MEWKEQMQQYIQMVEAHLKEVLQTPAEKNQPLIEAMAYSLFAGGKRLRPVLALASCHLFSKDVTGVLPYACGLEMIHTYSLVHDDLPAMDNDDYRRGKLTNHKVYGEGLAILAGDGLLNHAFEIMLQNSLTQPDPKPFVRSIYEIARAAGINGMIGGQMVDLASEGKRIDADTLDYIHNHKTAALIEAPLKIGAIIGRAQEKDIENMAIVGRKLGLAFQIQDDILDIVGDEKKLGKKIGSDINNEKSTYPSLYGIEASKEKVKHLTKEILEILTQYQSADFLINLSQYLVDRES